MEAIKSRKLIYYVLFYALSIGLGIPCTVFGVVLLFSRSVAGEIFGIFFILSAIALFGLNIVYRVYFYYSLSLDVDAVCKGDGRESGSYVAAAALSTLTLGFYNIYWTYKIGQRLHANAPRYGFKIVETGKDIALLDAFSFGYVSTYELLKNMNRIARVYNQSGTVGIYGGVQ